MPEFHRVTSMTYVVLCMFALWLGLAPVLQSTALAEAHDAVFEYPVRMLQAHDADGICWRGMDANGVWHEPGAAPGVRVVPQDWLVGPPPSALSAVTIPNDHWIHLAFSGPIFDGNDADIILLESGKVGEQALVFLTDGADQEYVLALAVAEQTGQQETSRIELDLSANPSPFVARGVRVVGIDLGGGSPGFDLASISARISHECGVKATCPNPPSGTAGIEPDAQLNWTPACTAAEQHIYFSEVESQVRSRSAEARCAFLPGDANTFQPPQIGFGRTYYWCVDSIPMDANAPSGSEVWSFTAAGRLVIDNFETYLDSEPSQNVWNCSGWSDAYVGAATSQTCDHFVSLEYAYDGTGHSEAVRRLDPPQDWTRLGARILRLLMRGTPLDPAIAQTYVSITDGLREQFVSYDVQMDIDSDTDWYAWRIALDDFNNVDLTHVCGLTIGIRPCPGQPGSLYTGLLSITDISLHPARCSPCMDLATSCVTFYGPHDMDTEQDQAGQGPAADLNADCIVDWRDMEQLAADWLCTATRTCPVATPNEPVLWYTFDGHVTDRAGSAHGLLQGRAQFVPGLEGLAVRFAYQGDAVTVSNTTNAFAGIREAITIAFWQCGDDSTHLNDTICCSDYEYGVSNPAIAINLGCWESPGQYRWDCGYPWSIENRLAGRHRDKIEWTGRWNHWAFTKDIRAGGRMEIYLNGILHDSRTGSDSPITGITSFEIGSGWYGRYDGIIDDFRIYSYALSPAEVAWLATNGSGIVEDPEHPCANLDGANGVDLHDFLLLAAQWLQDARWP